ncbi:MAG: hydroxyisourate hydrolase [Hydrogenovibrio sp.]
MTGLTTHILDTSSGQPADQVSIKLYALNEDGTRQLLTETRSNDDGRTDAPLLSSDAFAVGRYELIFEMGAYFKQHHPNLPSPLFLDDIVLRFGIADVTSHYHVPLLASPYGYSTYRGS